MSFGMIVSFLIGILLYALAIWAVGKLGLELPLRWL